VAEPCAVLSASDASVLEGLDGIPAGGSEDQPRIGRAFVSLLRCRRRVGQRRLDHSDLQYLESMLVPRLH
jgi:hypothetical protein